MNCKHDIAMNNFEVNKMLHISETFSFFYEVQHASAEMGTMVHWYHRIIAMGIFAFWLKVKETISSVNLMNLHSVIVIISRKNKSETNSQFKLPKGCSQCKSMNGFKTVVLLD